jgi:alpha-glucosidase
MSPARRVIRTNTMDLPEVHDAVAAMRRVSDEYPGGRVLIGEAYLPIDRLMMYYGADLSGFHLPFNFHLLSTPWKAREIGALVERYEAALPPGGWPNWVLGNHDRSRVASRLGAAQARVAAMLLLTLRGTPTLYQGDEIGMEDVPIPPERVQDPWERNVPGLGLGRDPVRTPMQWDAGPNAGFAPEGAEPWLPLAADRAARNVAAQAADPRSMLSLHRALLALRRVEPALSAGAYAPVQGAEEDVLAYERRDDATGRSLLVALNLGGRERALPRAGSGERRVLFSTRMDGGAARLRPDEGVVLG